MDLISVIVPVYNVRNYLEKCVKSITAQTEKNIQIILVDDGSTDGSSLICDELSKNDDRIEVFHKENGGLSSARNFGISKAKGEYVCFIDSDDIISPYFVEHLLFFIKKCDCDVAVGKYECFTEAEPVFSNEDMGFELVEGKKAVDKLFGESCINATIACNKLYKKTLFDDLKFPEGLFNEDEAVAYRIFYKTKRVAFSNNIVYGYYVREGSITKSPFSKRNFDYLQISWERCLFFKEHSEERYYYLFLKKYCWELLEYAKKTRKFIGDTKKSKELVKEFKEKSKILLKSPYMSRIKKIAVKLIRALPMMYFVFKKLGTKKKYITLMRHNIKIRLAFLFKRRKKRVVIVATPTHGNLGDQAIVYAEKRMIKSILPNHYIIEIENDAYLKCKNLLKRFIKQSDIIVIDGGGNLGTLWEREDDKISDIISTFYQNKIVIFPQTVYYAETNEANQRVERNNKVYSQAEDLTVLLRDKKSFGFFSQAFPQTKARLCPDIVLSLDQKKKLKREGVLLCFRSDHEKVIEDEEKVILNEYMRDKGIGFKSTDTVIKKTIRWFNRNNELRKKWKEFSQSKLVVTDRLHAMIFSYITDTPCIAINNSSKKVEGAYEFIKDCNYLKMADNIEQAIEKIPMLMDIGDEKTKDFIYPINILEETLKDGDTKQ